MTRRLSCSETAQLIRKALAEKFPATKFTVNSKTYAGGASVRVRWLDGPTIKAVEAIAGRFAGADFDSSQDLKTYRDSTLNGEPVHFGADYVFCDRDFSVPLLSKAAEQIAHQYYCPAPAVHEEHGKGWVERDGNLVSGHWTAGDLAYRVAQNMTAEALYQVVPYVADPRD